MKAILRLNDGGDSYKIYTSKRNLTDVMRELWEDAYDDCLADDIEMSEEDTWFEDDQSQIVSIGGKYISEFKILEIKEI